MRHAINFLLIILWMVFIFYMSSQGGEASGEMSGRVMQLFAFLGIDSTSRFGDALHLAVRKGAHLFEYFILSLLFYNFLTGFTKGKKTLLLPVFFSFLYACTDEIHQYFVPGRVASFMDVLIDTLGAALAMGLVILYKKTIKPWGREASADPVSTHDDGRRIM